MTNQFNREARAKLLADMDAGLMPSPYLVRALCERLDAVEEMVREMGTCYLDALTLIASYLDAHEKQRGAAIELSNDARANHLLGVGQVFLARPDIAALLEGGAK